MKKILKKLLLGSGVLLLIFSFGCESDDLKDKDDTEDRFQFLRRDEHESVKDSSVPLKDEEVLSKAPYPHPVSEEKIKKLEVRPIPKAKIIPICAKTGEGIDEWAKWLSENIDEAMK